MGSEHSQDNDLFFEELGDETPQGVDKATQTPPPKTCDRASSTRVDGRDAGLRRIQRLPDRLVETHEANWKLLRYMVDEY